MTDLDRVTLHGRSIAFRRADTPRGDRAILLVHGITNDASSWAPVVERLEGEHDVLAPDLPGHGASDRQRGDHSLGAHASVLRDLVEALHVDRVTVVGHSLGGGIAMQFAYQFPEHVERLVLVSSGGLGREVSPLIRAAALPFAEHALGLLGLPGVRGGAMAVGGALRKVGFEPGADLAEVARGVSSLSDAQRRQAFVRTVRSVVSVAGQRVNATDRLYLAGQVPTLVVWGTKDPVIPVSHAHAAHAAIPGSRLELFEGCGHFPQLDAPDRFAELLHGFIAGTEPARYDRARLRAALRDGA